MNALNISERTMNPLGTGSPARDIRQRLAPLPPAAWASSSSGDFVKPCQIWTHDAGLPFCSNSRRMAGVLFRETGCGAVFSAAAVLQLLS